MHLETPAKIHSLLPQTLLPFPSYSSVTRWVNSPQQIINGNYIPLIVSIKVRPWVPTCVLILPHLFTF